MENLQGMGAPVRENGGFRFQPRAVAFAVAMALGLSACGGGGGGNVRPTSPPPPPAGGTAFTGGEIDVDANSVTVLPDNLGGSINLIKGGAGTLVLTGNNVYIGGTTITNGTLQVGNGGTSGSINGNITDNAVLAFDRSDIVGFGVVVSGPGSLKQIGNGTLILVGANTYTGGTTISSGTLQLGDGGTSGSIVGNVVDNGTLIFDRSDDFSFAGTITGTGGLVMSGTGSLTLTGSNSYTGGTQVQAGGLYIDGNQSGATGTITVADDATLGGKGIIGGDVNIAEGATLAPGSKGAIGTLTINGNLALSIGSKLDYDFAATSGGIQLSDLVNVKGNLILDGTLNVSVAQGGDLGPGIHRLFNYDGTLTDNGLALGSMPSSGWAVQTGASGQINLVDTRGLIFSFWDGDAGPKGNNAVNGGNGIWRSGGLPATNDWTDVNGAVNAAFTDGAFAVFQSTPGTVTVDAGNGDIHTSGMQFASSGYTIQGDTIHLIGSSGDPTESVIRVGDGTTAGKNYVATINSVLDGTTTLVKTDAGTLVLGADNDYTGGTVINGGVLQIGNGGATGSVIGDITDNGSLAFDRFDNVTLDHVIGGSGSLTQAGLGTLIVTGANTYTGGTTVTNGILEIASGGAIGSGTVTVGIDSWSPSSNYTLQVDHGASLSNRILLNGLAKLDNAGAIGGNVDFGAEGNVVYNAYNAQVVNHDGGTIEGNVAGLIFNSYAASITNSTGGVIEGGSAAVRLGSGGAVTNDGIGSTISSPQIAVQAFLNVSQVENRAGGTITGGLAAIDFLYGGFVNNLGAGSLISSPAGGAVEFTSNIGYVDNDGGATITSGKTALYMGQGGTVSNGVGSTIEATGATGGDCATTGICSIFVAAGGQAAGDPAPALTLTNAGDIIGNVQLNATADNDITLLAGSSIHGDLEIGSNYGASLLLTGETTQLYSQAVTGTTTFAGDLSKRGNGTWIIDNDDLNPDTTTISEGVLQVGNGGTQGSIGDANITIYGGKLVFDRSDDVVYSGGITSAHSESYDGTLVQAGSGTLTLRMDNDISPTHIIVQSGTLQIDNTGALPSCQCINYLESDVENDASLVFNSNWTIYAGIVTGTGSVSQNGSGNTILQGQNTYTGGTTVNNGALYAEHILPGNVNVNPAGFLGGFTGVSPFPGLPGVAGNLANAGKVSVRLGDSLIGGNYTQSSTGTLAISLDSKLAVTGTATLNGGTLEITGADPSYVSNTHTNVLTATGGVNGTFASLVKDTGVVFTSSTINYDANSVWLDTTGLNITNAIVSHGGTFTPASFGSAQRVQSAFTQLDSKIATGNVASVSDDFVKAAGQFQQAPTVQAAQASLQSLSGQLHAASAAMTFEAIDASSRALSDRFDDLLGKNVGYGMWTHSLSMDGDMSRSGYDGVGFQLNGWLVGEDRQIGRNGVAGFAFGQSQGRQQLDQSYDRDHSRSTEGMFYAGWLDGNWYTQGRVGVGHFQQDVNRQVLLGYSAQGVSTDYSGNYNVAYGESGLHLNWGSTRLMPFVNVEYASIDRDSFAEQGAGGFGLRSDAQTLDRWQAGVGMRANHHWDLGGGRALDFNASAQWQRTLASHGDVFDASFVGMQQWQPLEGIGLSRYSGVLDVGLDATLSRSTALKFGYEYETGQRDEAQMVSARVIVAF